MLDRLASELVLAILPQVDVPSLRQLCSVCIRLRDLAQPLLWREITLTQPRAVNILLRLLEGNEVDEGARKPTRTLRSSNKARLSTSKVVDVGRRLPSLRVLELRGGSEGDELDLQSVSFPNLDTLCLSHIEISNLNSTVFLPSLSTLSLAFLAFPAPIALTLFTSASLPSLRYLSLKSTTVGSDPPKPFHPPPSFLAQLALIQVDARDLLPLLSDPLPYLALPFDAMPCPLHVSLTSTRKDLDFPDILSLLRARSSASALHLCIPCLKAPSKRTADDHYHLVGVLSDVLSFPTPPISLHLPKVLRPDPERKDPWDVRTGMLVGDVGERGTAVVWQEEDGAGEPGSGISEGVKAYFCQS